MLDLTPPLPPSAAQTRQMQAQFWNAVKIAGGFIAGLWLILWAIAQQHIDAGSFGIYPRNLATLPGILTAPLVHSGIEHLLANSFGLLVLGVLTLYRYPQSAPMAIPVIWLLSGIITWAIGRPSFHIGASGISHGLMFFIFVSGLIRRDRTAIVAAMLSFLLFGGMLHTILPRDESISFEYHLAGAIAGGLCAILLRRRDPAPPRRKYSWEIEEEWEALRARDELNLPRPEQVPVLWQRVEQQHGQILQFPDRHRDNDSGDRGPTLH